MPLRTTPDHVAVAVPSIDRAAPRWHAELGGAWLMPTYANEAAGFNTRQLEYPGGGRLELLEPGRENSFGTRFLARHGAGVHHLTLKVPDLLAAVALAAEAGLEAVDVSAEGEIWHEAFLRPSQIGGLIVQLAWQGWSDERWFEEHGVAPEPIRPDGAELLGPTLQHPDPEEAARVWTVLGGEVRSDADHLEVVWADAPLTVRIERGAHPRAVGVRFRGGPALPADPTLGAATLLG